MSFVSISFRGGMIPRTALRCAQLINVPSQHSRRHMSVISLSDENAVKKFHAGNNKSILYFTAVWCPPCKVISPIYEELSKCHEEIAFGKVDVDVNADSAGEFNISSVPTFIFFKGDKVVSTFGGADRTKLESSIQHLIKAT